MMIIKRSLLMAVAVLGSGPAFAHPAPTENWSLIAGLSHPLFGLDHVLAMVAVGLWAALLGGRSVWLVPASFVSVMSVGFALALVGFALPFVEPAILASVIVLGLCAAIALRVPAAVGMIAVGFFATFHGSAHGAEIGTASALGFGAGFVIATALLHATGVAAGASLVRVLGNAQGRTVVQLAGAATVMGGFAMIFAG